MIYKLRRAYIPNETLLRVFGISDDELDFDSIVTYHAYAYDENGVIKSDYEPLVVYRPNEQLMGIWKNGQVTWVDDVDSVTNVAEYF